MDRPTIVTLSYQLIKKKKKEKTERKIFYYPISTKTTIEKEKGLKKPCAIPTNRQELEKLK